MINVPNPKRLVRAWVILAAMSVPIPAFAGLRSYVGPDGGNWNNAANWRPTAVPPNRNDVWITPSFTQTGGTNNVSQLQVGARFAGGTGNYSISNGTINSSVILVGDPGNGYFNQTGGNVNAFVLQTGIGGSYNLSDGNLTVTNFIN